MVKKKGFSLLEMIVAIFLMAVVIGTVLLLMASNLNVINKANEIMISNALAQYSIEEVKNIEFPPVYSDRQDYFGKEITDEGSIDITNPDLDADFTPPEFADKFEIRRYNISYLSDGTIVDTNATESQQTYNDKSFIRKVIVYVLRKRDNAVISKREIYISRNGMF